MPIFQSLVATLALLPMIFARPTTETMAVCEYLHRKYPHLVAFDPRGTHGAWTTANKTLYIETTAQFMTARSPDVRPACAYFPGELEHVSDVVRRLNTFSPPGAALKKNIGSRDTGDAVLVSFRPNMATAALAQDGCTIDIEAGGRKVDLDASLKHSHKRAIGGQQCKRGLGGFLLGTGPTYLDGQYGLTCDNAVDYQLILGDGSMINANANQNQGVFMALRDGTYSDFGLITKFTLKTRDFGEL